MGSLAHRVQQRAELEAKKQDIGTQTADLEENANQSDLFETNHSEEIL